MKQKICARTRKHAVDEIVAEMQSRAQRHAVAEYIGEQVYSALVQEARLSPKPGLVDTINNGSHKDMTCIPLSKVRSVYALFYAIRTQRHDHRPFA